MLESLELEIREIILSMQRKQRKGADQSVV